MSAAHVDELGAEVYQHRANLGISQAELAKLLKVSPKTVGRWEQGKTACSATSLLTLRRLAARKRREEER